MNYAQARLRIWNPAVYSKEEVRRAAVFIIGTIGARKEDLHQAYNLI